MQTTFTVLVTVTHEPEAGHSASRIAEAIQTALEEGTSNTASFLSAQVDAFKGLLIVGGGECPSASDIARLSRVLPLHLA